MFHSENLVSNEIRFQRHSAGAHAGRRAGARLRRRRLRAELHLHRRRAPARSRSSSTCAAAISISTSPYKALFEMSADRAEFVSRLFSRARPAGLSPASTANQIFDAYTRVAPDEALYAQNLKAIGSASARQARHRARRRRSRRAPLRLPLVARRRARPALSTDHRRRTGAAAGLAAAECQPASAGWAAGAVAEAACHRRHADLMTADDGSGRQRSYLATEDSFRFIKDLDDAQPDRPGGRQLRGPDGAARGGGLPQTAEADRVGVLPLQRSSSTCGRTGSGTRSARTRRCCRLTSRACSSAPSAAAAGSA